MTEAKDNSSLPLLLSITGAVLVVAVGGWFFLGLESSRPGETQDTPTATEDTGAVTSTEGVPLDGAETVADIEAPAETTAVPNEPASPDVDAELRKARLAADADILVFPPLQSALYYYGRVLKADPQHAIAIAELDAILAKVAQTVTQHLGVDEFDDAYAIAVLVAKQQPEHPLVVETQQTLDDYTEQLVEQAIQHARDADDDQAAEALATAEGLPGRNPQYFTAIRDSIAEMRDVRLAAERDRAERAQLAANDARAAWVDRIRTATAQGDLISPAGASAIDLLAEPNSWTAEREQLTGEVLSAIVGAAQSSTNEQRLDDAEALLNAAAGLSGEPDGFEDLRASLERAFVEAESRRIAHMKELVQLKSVGPRYPRRAQERDLSGWVDVYFTVTPAGETADIEVSKRSDEEPVFDRAAIDAVAAWEFQPVQYRGQVISQRAAARLVFRIE